MNYRSLVPVTGVIQNVSRMPGECCSQMVSLNTADGQVDFVVSADTLVIDSMRLRPGMAVAAFYDANRPVPLIFPPRYQAVIITQIREGENIMLNFFNRNLLAQDNSLRLNIGRFTDVLTANGQRFGCSPGGNNLLVYYSNTTRSIPPQTTPRRIVVFCG